jgi:ribosomal protein L7/L12
MAHNPFPFTRDSHPDLTRAILGVVNESHTRAQLERMSITRLRELLKQYTAKPGSGRELADIRGLLRAKGAASALDETLEEAVVSYALVVDNRIVFRGNKAACLKLAKKEHGGLKRGKVFITQTPKTVGEVFQKDTTP